jgi:hypothetical protein
MPPEIYNIRIERNDNEYEVTEHNFPPDKEGKVFLSLLLMQIAQHLNPQITVMTTKDRNNDYN